MNLEYLANIKPAHRQLLWQRMEMYAFIHFGMNTMTDREWGIGHEDPALFNPGDVDTDRWMEVLKDAGMTGIILTCKHHDGFCLWPSKYSRHTVAASPWRGGHGDLVREVSDSARRHGLKFGIYLSPWDRTEATYGQGAPYDDFYVNQLVELLTRYGPIFSVWLDGACGEGPNGRRQRYDWDRYYQVIRSLQPEAVISVSGPDVRWCGNEAGYVRRNEWSVVPRRLQSAELTAEKSQKCDDGHFSRLVRSDEEDLGSRSALSDYDGPLVWYPAEVNTSIRPGWFHHASENVEVRTADELFSLWLSAVGGNACFLLNVPPDRDGRFSPGDVGSLTGLGARIRDFRRRFITTGMSMYYSSNPLGVWKDQLTSTDPDSGYWMADADDRMPKIVIDFDRQRRIDAFVLREHIELGQRVEGAELYGGRGSDMRLLAASESVGYQRIWRFEPVEISHLELRINEFRATPMLSFCAAVEAG